MGKYKNIEEDILGRSYETPIMIDSISILGKRIHILNVDQDVRIVKQGKFSTLTGDSIVGIQNTLHPQGLAELVFGGGEGKIYLPQTPDEIEAFEYRIGFDPISAYLESKEINLPLKEQISNLENLRWYIKEKMKR